MRNIFQILAVTALLVAGCSTVNAPKQPADLPLCYHNAQYDFKFYLPAGWRGYSTLSQQWEGITYSPAEDKQIVVGHNMMITLRNPQWTASAPYQDITILVFTRAQWSALHQGDLWPSLFAGGMMYELSHNQKFVFAMSSRYDCDDSVKGWKETTDIVERNFAAIHTPHLYPE